MEFYIFYLEAVVYLFNLFFFSNDNSANIEIRLLKTILRLTCKYSSYLGEKMNKKFKMILSDSDENIIL